MIDTTLEKILIQLEEKDRQIALLSEQVKFQDEEIKRRSEEILELTKAFREAQALHAGTMQRELTDNKRKWWKFWKEFVLCLHMLIRHVESTMADTYPDEEINVKSLL